jgi:general secretion pathway protein I
MSRHRAAALIGSSTRKTSLETGAARQAARLQPARLRGFTLVEVLVALGIVAVALAAGVRATASLSRNAERQSDLLLAHLCAENALTTVRLSRQMPPVGDNTSSCEQAGRTLAVRLSVQPTPNPNFLRTEAQVFDGNVRLLNLSTIVGRY